MAVCNICNNDQFKAAPYGRLSPSGQPPVCTRCGSLERHRIHRLILNRIRDASFKAGSCLQFSADPAIARGWFERHELSAYGGPNSLDIQDIDRGNASYDVVVCNHVIEHVADYQLAINELVRITKPDGFLFLSFPNPHGRAATEDWGYPKPEQHGHYRVFGRDIEQTFTKVAPQVHVIAVQDTDPVTGVTDSAYILTCSDRWLARIFEQGCRARICQARREDGAGSRRRVLRYRERSVTAAKPSGRRRWYLISLCNLGRFASRYSVAAVSDSFDDVCWLDLDGVINPEKDLGVAGLGVSGTGQLYLAVQSPEPRLVQLDPELRVVRSVPLWSAQDPVSLAVEGTAVYLAPPADNKVYAIDMAAASGVEEIACLSDETGASLHPGGIAVGPDGLIVSGFGVSAADSGSPVPGSVVDVKSGRVLMADIPEPRSVAFDGEVLHVLSSPSGEYLRKRGDGPRRRHLIGGYLRGLCIEQEHVLIGRSAAGPAVPLPGSTEPRAPGANLQGDPSQSPAVIVVSPATGALDTIDFSLLGSEIFDIVSLPAGLAPARTFADPVRRRVASLREAQLRLEQELKAARAAAVEIIGFEDGQ